MGVNSFIYSRLRTSFAFHGSVIRVLKGRVDNLLEKALVSHSIEKENECHGFAGEDHLEFFNRSIGDAVTTFKSPKDFNLIVYSIELPCDLRSSKEIQLILRNHFFAARYQYE